MKTCINRRLALAGLAALGSGWTCAHAQSTDRVLIAIDGEFGLSNSTSAQAVELGARMAMAEINRAGGVMGKQLDVITRDHRSIPARGIKNIQELAAMPEVVAVLGGRFSPVVIEQLPLLRQAKLPFVAVWSSADMIVDNGSKPNFVFRVSLRDSLAMPFMMSSAQRRGIRQIGLLLTNTSWGRSNQAAAASYSARSAGPRIVKTAWYNWQEPSLVDRYLQLREAGAQAIVLVANDDEAAVLVREVAALPREQRLPIISHWGVTGGRFVQASGPALQEVDFTVIQTFSFFKAEPGPLARFMATASDFGVKRIEDIESPVGVAHAYDAVHLLALAMRTARSTERSAVRDALERLPAHQGLVRRYAPAFTSARHEALGKEQLLMARYRADGALVPA